MCPKKLKDKPFIKCCPKCFKTLKLDEQEHSCIDIIAMANRMDDKKRKKVFTPKRWGETAEPLKIPKNPKKSTNLIFCDCETILDKSNCHQVQKWCAITYLGKEKVFDTTAEFVDWFLNEYEREDKK